MARRTHRTFGHSKGRLTQWVGPANQAYGAVASGGATIIASFSFEEALTIVRTRGVVSVIPQTAAADVDVVGAFGIGVVTQEAFAAGVASIPEPFTDADWGGWFVWRTFAFRQEFSDATGILLQNYNFEIDSKAMRKVSPNEVMVVVSESQVGAHSVFDGTRHLLKLS